MLMPRSRKRGRLVPDGIGRLLEKRFGVVENHLDVRHELSLVALGM
jgi:hypothetical protein